MTKSLTVNLGYIYIYTGMLASSNCPKQSFGRQLLDAKQFEMLSGRKTTNAHSKQSL